MILGLKTINTRHGRNSGFEGNTFQLTPYYDSFEPLLFLGIQAFKGTSPGD